MTQTKLALRDEARAKLLAGATALADAVRVTLGPSSKCIVVQRRWGAPLVCDDGVTIAKQIELEDPEQDLGVKVLRQAAERTGDAVGDGTTSSTLLAHAIFTEGLRNVVAGASAIDIKRGLDRGLEAAVTCLREMARPLTTHDERVQVGTISGHNDRSIGELVASAIERVGPEGAVSVEEAKGTETELEVVEGMRIDRGYLSPYFVTDPERMEAIHDDPLILLHDKKIGSIKDLVPVLEETARLNRSLVVVAEDVQADALTTLVVNRIRGTLSCTAIKAPGFGDRRRDMLLDMAVLTGTSVVSDELGSTLTDVKAEQLGNAKRVVIDKDSTTIVAGAGDKAAIEGRCAEIRKQIEKATSDYDREKLSERLARLAGGVAVIRAGAPSETEMKNRKEAFEDAISATKAAVTEGIVPGGGVALLRCLAALENAEQDSEGDVRTGLHILKRAFEAPVRQIAANSGFDPGVVVDHLLTGSETVGFDATTGRYGDMFEAGIIDPVKVVRVGLENAISVAGILLLAEGTLTEVPEQEKAPGAPGINGF